MSVEQEDGLWTGKIVLGQGVENLVLDLEPAALMVTERPRIKPLRAYHP
jgi:hypothetical protein